MLSVLLHVKWRVLRQRPEAIRGVEQVGVGQDDVHVTDLSGAANLLELLHVSSEEEKYSSSNP